MQSHTTEPWPILHWNCLFFLGWNGGTSSYFVYISFWIQWEKKNMYELTHSHTRGCALRTNSLQLVFAVINIMRIDSLRVKDSDICLVFMLALLWMFECVYIQIHLLLLLFFTSCLMDVFFSRMVFAILFGQINRWYSFDSVAANISKWLFNRCSNAFALFNL